MLKSDFYYDLPPELIAQIPVYPRDSSRLMKIGRSTGEIEHTRFFELGKYLRPGDLLVMNNSKVFPARIFGVKRGGEVKVQFLLLKQRGLDEWEVLVKPGRRLKKGAFVDFPLGLSAEITDIIDDGNRIARFHYDGVFFDILDKIGKMPLPPYITKELEDNDRYNTVYSKETGSAAAPTAGLHFTEELLDKIRAEGVETAEVTLHVGLGTFRPVKEQHIENHLMHSEFYSIPEETAEKIKSVKSAGGRVIAVGTTSCRTLEAAALKNGEVRAGCGNTSIFLYPGCDFKVIDGLITNFHLPESTLLMLVSAFLGREKTLAAYQTAINEKYRFFSFGDAMIII